MHLKFPSEIVLAKVLLSTIIIHVVEVAVMDLISGDICTHRQIERLKEIEGVKSDHKISRTIPFVVVHTILIIMLRLVLLVINRHQAHQRKKRYAQDTSALPEPPRISSYNMNVLNGKCSPTNPPTSERSELMLTLEDLEENTTTNQSNNQAVPPVSKDMTFNKASELISSGGKTNLSNVAVINVDRNNLLQSQAENKVTGHVTTRNNGDEEIPVEDGDDFSVSYTFILCIFVIVIFFITLVSSNDLVTYFSEISGKCFLLLQVLWLVTSTENMEYVERKMTNFFAMHFQVQC